MRRVQAERREGSRLYNYLETLNLLQLARCLREFRQLPFVQVQGNE